MRHRIQHGLALALAAIALAFSALSHAEAPKIGIVIMHGKGGSPNKFVDGLAASLAAKGYLVANIEMPWSGQRDYDVPTEKADAEILGALADLKARGAQKVFVAGHSQGGAFALHFGATHPVDGVVAIAPGGSVSARIYAEKLGGTLAEARQLIAEGKGKDKARLMDYEGSKGTYPIVTTPENFVSWFDPAGAMDMTRAARELKAPILWIVAAHDYPGLRATNLPLYRGFPPNPLNKLYEPDADHLRAPAASVDEIAAWTAAVAARR